MSMPMLAFRFGVMCIIAGADDSGLTANVTEADKLLFCKTASAFNGNATAPFFDGYTCADMIFGLKMKMPTLADFDGSKEKCAAGAPGLGRRLEEESDGNIAMMLAMYAPVCCSDSLSPCTEYIPQVCASVTDFKGSAIYVEGHAHEDEHDKKDEHEHGSSSHHCQWSDDVSYLTAPATGPSQRMGANESMNGSNVTGDHGPEHGEHHHGEEDDLEALREARVEALREALRNAGLMDMLSGVQGGDEISEELLGQMRQKGVLESMMLMMDCHEDTSHSSEGQGGQGGHDEPSPLTTCAMIASMFIGKFDTASKDTCYANMGEGTLAMMLQHVAKSCCGQMTTACDEFLTPLCENADQFDATAKVVTGDKPEDMDMCSNTKYWVPKMDAFDQDTCDNTMVQGAGMSATAGMEMLAAATMGGSPCCKDSKSKCSSYYVGTTAAPTTAKATDAPAEAPTKETTFKAEVEAAVPTASATTVENAGEVAKAKYAEAAGIAPEKVTAVATSKVKATYEFTSAITASNMEKIAAAAAGVDESKVTATLSSRRLGAHGATTGTKWDVAIEVESSAAAADVATKMKDTDTLVAKAAEAGITVDKPTVTEPTLKTEVAYTVAAEVAPTTEQINSIGAEMGGTATITEEAMVKDVTTTAAPTTVAPTTAAPTPGASGAMKQFGSQVATLAVALAALTQ